MALISSQTQKMKIKTKNTKSFGNLSKVARLYIYSYQTNIKTNRNNKQTKKQKNQT